MIAAQPAGAPRLAAMVLTERALDRDWMVERQLRRRGVSIRHDGVPEASR